jgi:hypothetical protein
MQAYLIAKLGVPDQLSAADDQRVNAQQERCPEDPLPSEVNHDVPELLQTREDTLPPAATPMAAIPHHHEPTHAAVGLCLSQTIHRDRMGIHGRRVPTAKLFMIAWRTHLQRIHAGATEARLNCNASTEFVGAVTTATETPDEDNESSRCLVSQYAGPKSHRHHHGLNVPACSDA